MKDSDNPEAKALGREFQRSFKSKKVLVTGGAGFLGSWLCDTLVASGADVVCLDDLSTGRAENVRGLQAAGKVITGQVESVEVPGDFDYLFHFASRASPEEYQTRPIETLLANSMGTLKMLKMATKQNSVLVYASSSEFYCDCKVFPTPENYFGNVSPTGVRSCYDEGKRFGEALCMAYFRQKETRVRLARIFNTYGRRIRADGNYGRALPRFLYQALLNKSITIYGDGKQTRSFSYVTDTIRGILMLASSDFDGEVFNIGNPEDITILELAKKIIHKTASKSLIKFMPPALDDPRRRCPDISKAMRLLGYKPKVKLDAGLIKLISQWRAEEELGRKAVNRLS